MALRGDPQVQAELAGLVRELRAARSSRSDLPQRLLAARLDVTPGSLVDWEVGRDAPTMVHLIRWARELNLTLQIAQRGQDPIRDQESQPRTCEGWEMRELRRLVLALHAARLAERLSQADVAAELGVHRWSISQWESGHGNPRPIGLLAWARALSRVVRLVSAEPE